MIMNVVLIHKVVFFSVYTQSVFTLHDNDKFKLKIVT